MYAMANVLGTLKEAGWSTNQPSDLSQTLIYDIFGHNLTFSKEEFQILKL